jgi:sugar-phosphatase
VPGILVTADEVTKGKPDPEPYLLAAQRMGAARGRCIVIEDAPAGVEAGKKAGMKVVGITTTHTRKELIEKGADIVIDKLTGLDFRNTSHRHTLVIQNE